jgi:hypothetical protein
MWYSPVAFFVDTRDMVRAWRDVAGAWLVCLLVAAVCFGLR